MFLVTNIQRVLICFMLIVKITQYSISNKQIERKWSGRKSKRRVDRGMPKEEEWGDRGCERPGVAARRVRVWF